MNEQLVIAKANSLSTLFTHVLSVLPLCLNRLCVYIELSNNRILSLRLEPKRNVRAYIERNFSIQLLNFENIYHFLLVIFEIWQIFGFYYNFAVKGILYFWSISIPFKHFINTEEKSQDSLNRWTITFYLLLRVVEFWISKLHFAHLTDIL